MNYYPEHLDAASELCKLLTDWHRKHTGTDLFVGEDIMIYTTDSAAPVGRIVLESGESFSFTPAIP